MSTRYDSNARTSFMNVLLLALLTAFIGACGGGGGDSGTSTGGSYGGGGGGGTTLEPNLASIQSNIFTPICTECHAGSSAPQGLRLEAGMSYGMLVNIASNEVPSLDRVEPGDPDNSYIIKKLEGTNSVGERMPFGGPYLDQADIDVIRQWITDGAAETTAVVSSKPSTLKSAWPVEGAELEAVPDKVILVADQELDSTRLHSESVLVYRIDAGNTTRIENVQMHVTSLAPTVLSLQLPKDLAEGRYEVRVLGSGPMAVVGRNSFTLDGDADGLPGGDFVLAFQIVR